MLEMWSASSRIGAVIPLMNLKAFVAGFKYELTQEMH